MAIVKSIGRKSDLLCAKLTNGKIVFGNSLNDLKEKLSGLAQHWKFSSSDAIAELGELFHQARQNDIIWNVSSGTQGEVDYIDNYLGIKLA